MRALKLVTLLALALTPGSRGEDARFFRIVGPVATTITAFSADGYVIWTNAPTNATFTVQSASSLRGPSNWVDYIQVPITNAITIHRLFDTNPSSGMVLIPAGSFAMGNCEATNEGSSALPLHTVNISAFYMDKYDVTKALWNGVYQWATNHGYSFDYAGEGAATNHPVMVIDWWDAVKWCNARSEKEGLLPAYYTDAGQGAVYRIGTNNLANDWVRWNAGYRLPTEAEWEKAARGGLSGHRFPWGDTISKSLANYYGHTNWYAYDLGPNGYNTNFTSGVWPYTTPVGSFAPNGYGLYDMAGNVWQWCWDWYNPSWYSYAGATQSDTRGPVSSPYGTRVLRGGSGRDDAYYAGCASRNRSSFPYYVGSELGFRCVRGL